MRPYIALEMKNKKWIGHWHTLEITKKILFMELGKQHKPLAYFSNTRFLQKMDQFKLIFVQSLVVVHRIWKVTLLFLEKMFRVCFIFAFFAGV